MIDRRKVMLSAGALAFTSLAPASRASTRGQGVDDAALAAMTTTGAKGLAVALIENGRVAYVQAYGLRNARGDALTTGTIMYGASITKAVFAYLVMQLVDEGRVDLDRPIAAMLPQPLPSYGNLGAYGNWGDLADDDRWRRITPRHVLTHSTGWANFAFLEPDQKLRFHFDPGTRFAYSGEGIILLQFGLEKGLGLRVGEELQRRVFDRFGMPDTSLVWRPAFASDLADGWTIDGKPERHDERSKVRAAGSMDTTITDLAQFVAGFMRGEGLSAKARAEMLRPQLPITTVSQFPTLQPEAPPAARFRNVSAGLGVVTFRGPQGAGFFKGGHNDSTGNIWVGIEKGSRSVLALGNDVRIEAAFPQLIAALLGETGAPWRWEYGTPS